MASLALRLRWRLLDIVRAIPVPVLVFFGVCPCCLSRQMTVARRRTRTAYADDESNYETSCLDCYEEHDRHWEERWNEYYGGRL